MANCPKCGNHINVNMISRNFVCPSCATKLRGDVYISYFITFVLWEILDFIIRYYLASADSLANSLIRLISDASVGIVLYYIIVGKTTIKIQE